MSNDLTLNLGSSLFDNIVHIFLIEILFIGIGSKSLNICLH